MRENAIRRLEYLCDTIPSLLMNIDEATFSIKPARDKWSKKEIIGHLIDSATNNHQRFVRGQFEDVPKIAYDQDKWAKYSFHQQIESRQLITFWTVYNRQLINLSRNISAENWNRKCETGNEKRYTLEFLLIDYVEHLEHHLGQVVTY